MPSAYVPLSPKAARLSGGPGTHTRAADSDADGTSQASWGHTAHKQPPGQQQAGLRCHQHPGQGCPPTELCRLGQGLLKEPSWRHLPEGLQEDAELLGAAQRKHGDQHLGDTHGRSLAIQPLGTAGSIQ